MTQEAHRLAQQSMAFVLAGGRGSRLYELTDPGVRSPQCIRRQKPYHRFSAVECRQLWHPAHRGCHPVQSAFADPALPAGLELFRAERNESLDILPASQQMNDENWYKGTADAVAQNADIIRGYAPKYIVILAGDHIYKQDYAQMIAHHVASGADVTVGCIEVPRMEATGFGVMKVDTEDRILDFVEKPADPPAMPGDPNTALASMGIYVFETEYLLDLLAETAQTPGYGHDFGGDVIPRIVREGKAIAHPFSRSCIRSSKEEKAYWRDVGTVDAFW